VVVGLKLLAVMLLLLLLLVVVLLLLVVVRHLLLLLKRLMRACGFGRRGSKGSRVRMMHMMNVL